MRSCSISPVAFSFMISLIDKRSMRFCLGKYSLSGGSFSKETAGKTSGRSAKNCFIADILSVLGQANLASAIILQYGFTSTPKTSKPLRFAAIKVLSFGGLNRFHPLLDFSPPKRRGGEILSKLLTQYIKNLFCLSQERVFILEVDKTIGPLFRIDYLTIHALKPVQASLPCSRSPYRSDGSCQRCPISPE